MLDEIRNNAFKEILKLEDIDQLEMAYKNAIYLAKASKSEGLLSLEYHANFIKGSTDLTDDFYWMVQLVTCATDPGIIEELVTIRFLVNDYKGIDALIYYLYARSILYIQEGVAPCVIEELFNACIPSVVAKEMSARCFDRESRIVTEENKHRLEMFNEMLSEATKTDIENVQRLIQDMTDSEWEQMTDNNGFIDWEWIVPAVSRQIRELIKNHMKKGRFIGYLSNINLPKDDEVEKACLEFNEKLKTIRKTADELNNSPIMQLLKCPKEDVLKVLYSVSYKVFAMALKGITKNEQLKILDCLDEHNRYLIEDEINLMGPVRMKDVIEAQNTIKASMPAGSK